MANDKVSTLNSFTKAELLHMIGSLGEDLEQKDQMIKELEEGHINWTKKVVSMLESNLKELKEKDSLICNLKEENRGLNDKISRLESQEVDVPDKDGVHTLEATIEKLVLENDDLNAKLITLSLELDGLHITKEEKHDKRNMEGRGSIRKCINFVKQKIFKPFSSYYSKYVEHRKCWHCGNIGHIRPVCPKRMHLRGDVPSNVCPSVAFPSV